MTGKIALIVGPGHAGLGESLANQFGMQGYQVALMGKNAAALAELVTNLTQNNVSAFSVQADLADPESVTRAIKTISE